jgi:hypothetical protein
MRKLCGHCCPVQRPPIFRSSFIDLTALDGSGCGGDPDIPPEGGGGGGPGQVRHQAEKNSHESSCWMGWPSWLYLRPEASFTLFASSNHHLFSSSGAYTKMSSTTTTTAPTLSLLADYELHHSTPSPSASLSSPPQSQSPAPVQQANPVNWPTHHRRIPPYRPINRNLDFAERSAGSSVPEYIFIQAMLHGVWLNAVCLPL